MPYMTVQEVPLDVCSVQPKVGCIPIGTQLHCNAQDIYIDIYVCVGQAKGGWFIAAYCDSKGCVSQLDCLSGVR